MKCQQAKRLRKINPVYEDVRPKDFSKGEEM